MTSLLSCLRKSSQRDDDVETYHPEFEERGFHQSVQAGDLSPHTGR